MNLPRQSQPIQRTIVGQPSPSQAALGQDGVRKDGVHASEYGVQPSFDWGSLLGTVAQTALPALFSAI
jgi:hypothetical protein